MSNLIPAATLILFRTGDGDDEHLFVERAATMTFAAGAIVFPGGRIDAGDRLLAARFPAIDHDDASARICAIRETIEEAGVAIGFLDPPTQAQITKIRAQLLDGMVFADVLAAADLALDLAALVEFARWSPKINQARNFDTRFYLAQVPRNAPVAVVDATENVRLFWASAQSVLDDAAADQVRVIYPTQRNLERLASLGNFDAAVLQARAITPDRIEPWIKTCGDEKYLCIATGRGYPITEQLLTSSVRG